MKKIILYTSVLLSIIACDRNNESNDNSKSSLNENFSEFIIDKTAQSGRKYGNLPQFDWTSSAPYPSVYVSQNATNSDNKYISAYNAGTDIPLYIFTPKLTSTKGKLSFSSLSNGEAKGSIQVGTITNPTSWNTFSAVGKIIAPTEKNATYEVEIPANSNKYIAFKIISPSGKHSFTTIDDVVFTQK